MNRVTTIDMSLPAPPAASRRLIPPNVPVAVTVSAIAVGASYLLLSVSARQAALFLVGALAGIVLYHAAFGFTTAWRVCIAQRRGAGIRAQMLLFAVTAVVFLPAIGMGQLFGQPVRGRSPRSAWAW